MFLRYGRLMQCVLDVFFSRMASQMRHDGIAAMSTMTR